MEHPGEVRGGSRDADPASRPGAAWHRIVVEADYIRAELFSRQNLDETRAFLNATIAAATEHRLTRFLICIRNSKPIFAVERYGFSGYLDFALKSQATIALIGGSKELRIAHQYYATLARLRGVNLRAFPEEAAAIAWLTSADRSRSSPGLP